MFAFFFFFRTESSHRILSPSAYFASQYTTVGLWDIYFFHQVLFSHSQPWVHHAFKALASEQASRAIKRTKINMCCDLKKKKNPGSLIFMKTCCWYRYIFSILFDRPHCTLSGRTRTYKHSELKWWERQKVIRGEKCEDQQNIPDRSPPPWTPTISLPRCCSWGIGPGPVHGEMSFISRI